MLGHVAIGDDGAGPPEPQTSACGPQGGNQNRSNENPITAVSQGDLHRAHGGRITIASGLSKVCVRASHIQWSRVSPRERMQPWSVDIGPVWVEDRRRSAYFVVAGNERISRPQPVLAQLPFHTLQSVESAAQAHALDRGANAASHFEKCDNDFRPAPVIPTAPRACHLQSIDNPEQDGSPPGPSRF